MPFGIKNRTEQIDSIVDEMTGAKPKPKPTKPKKDDKKKERKYEARMFMGRY